MVEETLLHFDGQRYRLAAWVIMPNHVHAMFEVWELPVPKLVKAWKAYTGAMANRLLHRSGAFWLPDYWDRYMRDEAHFNRARHYVEWNPVKAFLVKEPEQWEWSSANRRWRWDIVEGRTRYTGARLIHEQHGSADGHVRQEERKSPKRV